MRNSHPLDFSYPTSNLFEADSQVVLPASIIWPAETHALALGQATVRPQIMLVALDRDLAVYTQDGQMISNHLAVFLTAVKANVLSGLYVADLETAQALASFIVDTNAADLIVIVPSSRYELLGLLRSRSNRIYGVLDFRDIVDSTQDPADIVAKTHEAGARISLLPEDLAQRDQVDYIRSRLTSVWVWSANDTRSIYTHLTNGVNGIICQDFVKVIESIEAFSEVRALLRPSFIIGHRGLPSAYIENTIASGQAGLAAGADILEIDIHLSKDKIPFVLHDENLARLFNRADLPEVSELSLEQLQALSFDLTDLPSSEAPNSVLNANNENRTKDRRQAMTISYQEQRDYIPSLEEYLSSFQDTRVIHFIELKSTDPEIVPATKAVVEKLGIADRIVCISGNAGLYKNKEQAGYTDSINLLRRMSQEWPEIPLGYLGADGVNFANHFEIIQKTNKAEASLSLFSALNPYNASYNPYFKAMSYEVLEEGRHRGLTAWPWTYNLEEDFAQAYLQAISGITTNYATWASHLPRKFIVADQEIRPGEKLAYELLAVNGDRLEGRVDVISLAGLKVEFEEDGRVRGPERGQALVILRHIACLDLPVQAREIEDNRYAIYSNPFLLEIIQD